MFIVFLFLDYSRSQKNVQIKKKYQKTHFSVLKSFPFLAKNRLPKIFVKQNKFIFHYLKPKGSFKFFTSAF